MASGQVGRLSVRVLPDSSNFNRDLRKVLERAERKVKATIDVELRITNRTLRAVERQLRDLRVRIPVTAGLDAEARRALRDEIREISATVRADVDVNSTAASAQMRYVTRPRVIPIHARLVQSSLAQVSAQLAALSGARVLGDAVESLGRSLMNLDRSVPRIAAVNTAIAALSAVALAGTSNLFALGGSLAAIAPAAFALPGIFGGFAAGITTLGLALADTGDQLASLGPQLTALQDSVSSSVWAEMRQPILDMANAVLPRFQDQLTTTGTFVGEFGAEAAAALQDSLTTANLAPMFDNLNESISIAQGALRPLVEAFTTLGQVGSEYLPRLAQWFTDISVSFNDWVQAATDSGEIFEWIDTGIQGLQDLGRVIANAGGILAGFSRAAEAAGGASLGSLADGLQRVNEAINGPVWQGALTTVFEGAHQAMAALGPGVSALGDAFISLAPTLAQIMTLAGQIGSVALTAISSAFQNPVFQGGLIQFFEGVLIGVQGIAPAIAPLGAAFGQVAAFAGQLAAQLGPVLGAAIQVLAPVIGQLLAAVQPLIPVLGGALMQIIQALAPVIQAIVPIVAALAQVFAAVIPTIAQLVTALLPVLTPLLQVVGQTLQMMVPLIEVWNQALQKVIAAVAPLIVQLAQQLAPILMQLVQAIFPVLVAVIMQVIRVLPQLIPIFMMIVQTVMQLVAAFAPLIIQLVQRLAPIFMQLAQAVLPLVVSILGTLIPPIMNLVTTIASILIPIIEALLPVVETVFQTISSVIQSAMTIIQGVINVVMGIIQGDWSQVWEGIKQIASGVWDMITSLISGAINAVLGIISSVLSGISSLWNSAWSAIGDFLSTAWDGIVSSVKTGIENVKNFFRDLPGQIGDFLSNLPSQLSNIGQNMMNSLADSISNMGGAVMDAIGGVVDGAVDWAKGLLGIASPSKVFTQIGEWTGEGFADGITHSARLVQSATDGMVQQTQDAFNRRNAAIGRSNRDLERMRLPQLSVGAEASMRDVQGSLAVQAGSATTAGGMIVQGPLVELRDVRLDSDDRVKQLSQDLYRRATNAGRANGKVSLEGAVS